MTDCAEFRRRLTAEPSLAHSPTQDVARHLAACPECAAFAQRLLAFEDRLSRALKFEVAASADVPVGRLRSNVVPLFPGRGARAGKPWFAMAASLLAGVGIAALLWLGTSQRSLASDVVRHMADEQNAWTATDKRVSDADLAAVLEDAHVRILPNMNHVSYAMACRFRGHHVPHLVVQTEQGPVTVMVLAHENVAKSERFDEQGYHGVIVPMPGHGSVAVITRGTSAPNTARVVADLTNAIKWTP
jgi:hypothetical protein